MTAVQGTFWQVGVFVVEILVGGGGGKYRPRYRTSHKLLAIVVAVVRLTKERPSFGELTPPTTPGKSGRTPSSTSVGLVDDL